MFNTTFSNISGISWQPVLVVEEAKVLRESNRPCASNWSTLSLVAASRVHPFLQFTKLGANPRHIVWAVRSNVLWPNSLSHPGPLHVNNNRDYFQVLKPQIQILLPIDPVPWKLTPSKTDEKKDIVEVSFIGKENCNNGENYRPVMHM